MRIRMTWAAVLVATLSAALVAGCQWRELYEQPTTAPLGTISDSVWKNQEANAEASDFVVYESEFWPQTAVLNYHGEDHVKEIAARLTCGQNFPVVVERSMHSPDPDRTYEYPVYPNPALDMQRREILVLALSQMGVADAEARVVVAPAYAPGMQATEAERTTDFGSGFGGFFFGGGMGGF